MIRYPDIAKIPFSIAWKHGAFLTVLWTLVVHNGPRSVRARCVQEEVIRLSPTSARAAELLSTIASLHITLVPLMISTIVIQARRHAVFIENVKKEQ